MDEAWGYMFSDTQIKEESSYTDQPSTDIIWQSRKLTMTVIKYKGR